MLIKLVTACTQEAVRSGIGSMGCPKPRTMLANTAVHDLISGWAVTTVEHAGAHSVFLVVQIVGKSLWQSAGRWIMPWPNES